MVNPDQPLYHAKIFIILSRFNSLALTGIIMKSHVLCTGRVTVVCSHHSPASDPESEVRYAASLILGWEIRSAAALIHDWIYWYSHCIAFSLVAASVRHCCPEKVLPWQLTSLTAREFLGVVRSGWPRRRSSITRTKVRSMASLIPGWELRNAASLIPGWEVRNAASLVPGWELRNAASLVPGLR